MMILAIAAFILLSAPLTVAVLRANELFALRIRAGRVSVRRGRLPQRLLDDIADVVGSVQQASLRGVVEGGRPRLYAEGDLSAEHKQRLRNVIGSWSTAQIRTAPRAR